MSQGDAECQAEREDRFHRSLVACLVLTVSARRANPRPWRFPKPNPTDDRIRRGLVAEDDLQCAVGQEPGRDGERLDVGRLVGNARGKLRLVEQFRLTAALAGGKPHRLDAGVMVEVPPGEAKLVAFLRVESAGFEEHPLVVIGTGAEADVGHAIGVCPEVGRACDEPQLRPALDAVGRVRPAIEVAGQAIPLRRRLASTAL